MKNNAKSSPIADKWGVRASSLGWVAIPTLLLFSQRELKITSAEMNVLLNLIVHWWDKSEIPFPSQAAIVYRTGLSLKTVQRALTSLERKNLIIKTATSRSDPITRGRTMYDLSPLVDELDKVSVKVLEGLKERKNMVINNAN